MSEDAHEILTRCRVEGIRKLKDAGCANPANAYMWFEHYECDRNPIQARARIAQMGNESRRDIGRRAGESVLVKQASGETNRHQPNVIEYQGVEIDKDRDSYLGGRYGLRYSNEPTTLGTMTLDANGNEKVEAHNARRS